MLYNLLRRRNGDGSADLFSLIANDRMCVNGTDVQEGRFSLGIRRNLFTMRVVKHWNRFPREWLMSCAYQEAFVQCPQIICFNFWLVLNWKGSWMIFEGIFQSNYSILNSVCNSHAIYVHTYIHRCVYSKIKKIIIPFTCLLSNKDMTF